MEPSRPGPVSALHPRQRGRRAPGGPRDGAQRATPRLRSTRLPETAGLPAVEEFRFDFFALSDFTDPTRAGDWIDCARTECPNRAYLTAMYNTFHEALQAIEAAGREISRAVLRSRPEALTENHALTFHVMRVRVDGVSGRDYREHPCALPDVARQLREGHGLEAPWREVRRQRDEDHVEAVVLPGPPAQGQLFIFVDAAKRAVTIDRVAAVPWSWNKETSGA